MVSAPSRRTPRVWSDSSIRTGRSCVATSAIEAGCMRWSFVVIVGLLGCSAHRDVAGVAHHVGPRSGDDAFKTFDITRFGACPTCAAISNTTALIAAGSAANAAGG